MRINNISEIENLIPKKFIPRNLFQALERDINKREIQILYGPRQIGKSSLMYTLMKKIYSEDHDMFYFNMDQPEEAFSSAELFISDILSRKKTRGTSYIFIDEIQRKKDIGLLLKYIHDRNINFKFVVTGSSSLSIKNIISEPLTGRKFEYFLAPLDIFEILSFAGINLSKLERETPAVLTTIQEYLLFGGYPQVVLETTRENKFRKLSEIAKSYITRDLKDTFQIADTSALESVAIYLSQSIGNILSRENIAKTLSISVHRVNSYLEALEKSFIIGLLRPFYRNPVKELSHRPKIYFLDNGIRNVIVQRTHPDLIVSELGKLFEQTVWQILDSMYHSHVKYWRNINQTEVDFVVEKGNKLLAIETKYTYESSRLPKNLLSFKNIYKELLSGCQVITKNSLITLKP